MEGEYVHDNNDSNLHNLMDYYARRSNLSEMYLLDVLPFWISEARSERLKHALETYQSIASKQVGRMKVIFTQRHIRMNGTTNMAVQRFIEQTRATLLNCRDDVKKDAILLVSVSAINRFKINMYDMAAAFTRALGLHPMDTIFEDAGINEKNINSIFHQLEETDVDTSMINPVEISG